MNTPSLSQTLSEETTSLMLFIQDTEKWRNNKFDNLRELGFKLIDQQKANRFKSHIDGIYIERNNINSADNLQELINSIEKTIINMLDFLT